MHIQLSPLDVTVADRYFYFPMVGLLGILGIFISDTYISSSIKKSPYLQILISAGIFFVIGFLSIRTIVRNADWKDTKTLALHDLEIQKDNYQLLSALGAVYLGEKQYDKAIYYLQKSVALYPYWGTSQYNLAVSYHMSNHPKEAKMYYKKTIQNAPFYVNAYENMAILLLYYDSPKTTRLYTATALKKFPASSKMWHVLALADVKLGNTNEASQAAQMYYLLSSQSK
jgi:predicted Zn-dependent protease